MIHGMHHVAICTKDIDRLMAFYRDQFGMKVVFQRETFGEPNPDSDAIFGLKGASYRMAMLKSSNMHIEMFQFATPPGKEGDPNRPVVDAGITHTCFTVTDIESEYRRLTAAGMRFHCEPRVRPGFGKATYGRDPDGNVIELIELEPGCPFAV